MLYRSYRVICERIEEEVRVKSGLAVLTMAFALVPTSAQVNVCPIVESFTFTPNDVELISANTSISFELVVSHPSAVRGI